MGKYPKIQDYANHRLTEGKSLGAIKQELLGVGWKESIVDEELDEVLASLQVPIEDNKVKVDEEVSESGGVENQPVEQVDEQVDERKDEVEIEGQPEQQAVEQENMEEIVPAELGRDEPGEEVIPEIEAKQDRLAMAEADSKAAGFVAEKAGDEELVEPVEEKTEVQEKLEKELNTGEVVNEELSDETQPTAAPIKPNKKGGVVKFLLVLVVLGLFGGGGWYAWDNGLINEEMLSGIGGGQQELVEVPEQREEVVKKSVAFSEVVAANKDRKLWNQDMEIKYSMTVSDNENFLVEETQELSGDVSVESGLAAKLDIRSVYKGLTGLTTVPSEYEVRVVDGKLFIRGRVEGLENFVESQSDWVEVATGTDLERYGYNGLDGWGQFMAVGWWPLQQQLWSANVLGEVEEVGLETVGGEELNKFEVMVADDALDEFWVLLAEVLGEDLLAGLEKNQLQPGVKVEYWVDGDGMVKQFRQVLVFESKDREATVTGSLEVTSSLSELDDELAVEAPADFTNLEEKFAVADAEVRDGMRKRELNLILDALVEYREANDGELPEMVTEDKKEIGTGEDKIDLAGVLVPLYIESVPTEPSEGTDEATGYRVFVDENGKVIVQVRSELDEHVILQVSE